MKHVIFISILLLTPQILLGQKVLSKIDRLNSNKEVEKFIRSFLKDSHLIEKNEFTLIADSTNTQPFYKTDFDNNGLTDLLAIGSLPFSYSLSGQIDYKLHTFIVMNFGNDSLKMRTLSQGLMPKFELPKIINDTIIALGQTKLIFKFGAFIEFNPNPKAYMIKKIVYETTHCYGTCPVFRIEIKRDKTGIFTAKAYNSEKEISIAEYLFADATKIKEIKGTFSTTLREDSYSSIVDLLNYIDFPNLKDNYTVSWTDDQSCTLKIAYGNGQKKEIDDYGLIGTYGLSRLYQLFFDLRFNQKWK